MPHERLYTGPIRVQAQKKRIHYFANMSLSSVPIEETQATIGPSLGVFGMTPFHLYHRPATSTKELNVLILDTFDPIHSPLLSNKQHRKQLISLYENSAEMLEEKLRRTQSILTMLKNYTPPPQGVEHGPQHAQPTLVSCPANQPNLDATSCTKTTPLEPTLKELQTLSTIDEGTGQKVTITAGPGEFPQNLNGSAPTLAEIMKDWCSISD